MLVTENTKITKTDKNKSNNANANTIMTKTDKNTSNDTNTTV